VSTRFWEITIFLHKRGGLSQPRTQGITFAHPLLRKYPGAGWSRGSPILGAEINCYLGRGGSNDLLHIEIVSEFVK
jgi:hypothetical protein